MSLPAQAIPVLARRTEDASRVLIVGLEPSLVSRQYEVVTARDGVRALSMLATSYPDLVISDIHLPKLGDGIEFVSTIRADRRLAHVPVIFVSGPGSAPFKVLGLDAGANDFIISPVDSAELDARVRSQLRQSRAYTHLERQTLIDDLTGVYNRRGTLLALDQAFARWRRTGHPLAVLLVDVDDFKQINDTLGHLSGDAVLRDVAGALSESVRITDTVGRLGGDEFLVVLPDTPREVAELIAKRAADAARGISPERDAVSVSIGVGCADAGNESIAALIEAADRDMYRAKRSSAHTRRALVPVVVGPW